MQPNPNTIFPIKDCKSVTYIRPTIQNPNIIVGDFTYFSDIDFEKHVLHHYEFNGDRLIIGKFCQIASGVRFIMNGANHQLNSASTFPFYIMEGWNETPPVAEDLPNKGDTNVGNDVWIGYDAVIMAGVTIGDGAVVGTRTVVIKDVEPYSIVGGVPAKEIRKRFAPDVIERIRALQWWNWQEEKIRKTISMIQSGDIEALEKI